MFFEDCELPIEHCFFPLLASQAAKCTSKCSLPETMSFEIFEMFAFNCGVLLSLYHGDWLGGVKDSFRGKRVAVNGSSPVKAFMEARSLTDLAICVFDSITSDYAV